MRPRNMNLFKCFTKSLMSLTLLVVALATGCKGGQNPILGGGGIAALPPVVTAVTPLNNATSVPLSNPSITATFSEPMAAISGGASFTVVSAGAGPSPTGTVALDSTNRIATFTITSGALTPLNPYTATITGAKSLATGLALANPYVWSFTTGPIPDTTRPRVTITVPATTIPGPTPDVPTNTAISAAFTEDMASASILAAGTFTLKGPGTATVSGVVTYSSRTAVFTPATVLVADTTYTATITQAATDLAGNALAGNQAPLPVASDYIWTFRTGTVPDTTRPQVSFTVPATTIPGPTPNVSINSAISATFTKDMAPATILAAGTFTLTGPGTTAVSGAVTYASRTAVFTPAAVLLADTTYTATITAAATDLAGNALAGNQPPPLPSASNYIWTFRTGTTADTTRPRVTLTVPATTIPGPTLNVPNNTAITALFSKDMAPATINAATFTVTGPGGAPLNGGVSYASRTAVFTPSAVLLADTVYTARITQAATDLAGNQLAGNQPPPLPAASDYVWTFRTGLASDTTRPRVLLTVPATTIPGPTTGVPTNSAITAIFTKDMQPSTINAASFKVTGPGTTPVAGSVTYSIGFQTAVFKPTALLTTDTVYTATITKAATDLAGNALAGNQPPPLPAASDYVWTFRTGTPVPPSNVSVLSTNPMAGASNVCTTATINATFNVPSGLRMDPATVNTNTFTVTGPGPAFTPVIASSVVLDPATGRIATFMPGAALTVGVTYTATIKGGNSGVKDLAIPANTMLADFTWNFTVINCVVPNPSQLGSAAGFGIMATSAITNVPTSRINGDVSLEPGTSCGLLPAEVNGTIHINDSISHQARADLLTGYNYYKGLAPGVTISGGADLGALYPLGIPPGTYTSGSTMLVSTQLTFDGGGNANAVWVFQIGSSLTTNTPIGSMTLINGASAKNIFWVCTADATVGVNTTFYGTIITGRDATGQTGATINGRILAGAITPGTIALDKNTVNVPAP